MRESLVDIRAHRNMQDQDVGALRALRASLRPDKAVELGQGQGALARWERQVASWNAVQEELAARTGRAVTDTVMNRIEGFR